MNVCEGVWVLFDGSELHSLWNEEESLRVFLEENDLEDDPEYHYDWIRVED